MKKLSWFCWEEGSHQNKVDNQFTLLEGKERQELQKHKKKKHNHLTLIVLVRLLAVVFLYLLASSLSVKHKKM